MAVEDLTNTTPDQHRHCWHDGYGVHSRRNASICCKCREHQYNQPYDHIEHNDFEADHKYREALASPDFWKPKED